MPQLTHSGTSLDSSASSDAQSSWEGYGLEGGFLVDGGQHLVGGGDGMLWEHLRTGQTEKPVPTYTAHVHNADCGGSSGLHDRATGIPTNATLPISLPRTVLRLTGTKKAVKSFAGLLRSEAIAKTMSLEKVSDALRSNGLHLQANEHTSLPNAGVRVDNASRHTASTRRPDFVDSGMLATIAQSSQNANSAESGEGALRTSRRARKSGVSLPSLEGSRSSQRSQSSTLAASMLLEGVPGPLNGRTQLPLHQQRRPEPTLGEGIPETADPSLQLHMTRRRTAMTINTFCGANMNAGLPGGGTIGGAQLQSRDNPAAGVRLGGYRAQKNATVASSSANGGAYPRLEETNAILSRSRQPTFSDFAGITGALHKQDANANIRTVATTVMRASPAAVEVTQANTTSQDQVRPSTSVLLREHTETFATVIAGSETNRFRDHHGRRPDNTSSFFTSVLFFLLVSVSWLAKSSGAVAPSLFLLSLVQIYEAQKPQIEQCSGKNSWWLSTFASRQLGSTSSSSKAGVGKAKMHSLGGNCFEGFRNLHAMSPLRFAGAF